ncbi:flippase [Massilia sp. R2A-15]|uniref:flippase n=1 Tax=Massilia sp. R2A-15 TaxID=3064278 RepID=UPI00273446C6|nr:flippase [Massilia sp. R2A-15]WLI88045.1 flippase [Massilia sp. R2A-15]
MVVKNTVYNLAGLGLPLLVALGAMPMLIHNLGDARFGVLTLIWAVVSYFGLFDLGLGRALTQQLSVFIAEKREREIPTLVYSSVLVLSGLGVVAGVLMWVGASWGAQRISFHGDLREVIGSIRVMAIAMPFIVLTSGLRGILEARSAFKIINLIRLPMGIFTFLGPLVAVLWIKNDLVFVTLVLTVGRVVACVVHGYYAYLQIPGCLSDRKFNGGAIKELMSSGGWMTVSNIVSPLMGYLDRFLIGITISAAAVAYYVTPNEMITKLWIIPSALTAVIFPKFAVEIAARSTNAGKLFRKSVMVLFLTLYPITLALALFAHEILQVWVGPVFAQHSYVAMQIFSFGILVNCLAHIPFVLIQSAGKSRITAIVHVLEFVPFAIVLWFLSVNFGIIGAAVAWLLRMVIDTGVFFAIAGRIVGKERMDFGRLSTLCALVVISFLAGTLANELVKALIFVGSCLVIYCFTWFFLASEEDRSWVGALARRSPLT